MLQIGMNDSVVTSCCFQAFAWGQRKTVELGSCFVYDFLSPSITNYTVMLDIWWVGAKGAVYCLKT